MSQLATLLLVVRDERSVPTYRATLEVERRVRLVVATSAEEGLRIARETHPDMVVVSHDLQGMNVFAFCQALRQDPGAESTLVVVEIERGANDIRFAGLTFGVDEYLVRPVEPAEILVKVSTMLRLRKAYEAVRADQAELKQLHEHLRASFDQLLQLLARVLDMRLPGAAERGRRIAELARKVSDRFGIPATHLNDLEVAARLHELGRVVWSQDESDAAQGAREVEGWKYIAGTRAVFSQVDGLAGATELVGALYENWDGSGHPDHLQSGQIPLRSRILRVLVDLFAAMGTRSNPSTTDVLEELQDHAGTRYDPMVLVHLRAVLNGESEGDVRGRSVVVHVPELRVGMVLAEDLCTDSGLKLLARNTKLTHQTLEVIRRRHAAEPLASGATIARESLQA